MKSLRSIALTLGTVALLGTLVAAPAISDDRDDHERARRALEAGEIVPLRAILDTVERDTPGQIMEIELEREDGRWIYEVKVLRPGGSLVKLEIDGRNGAVLERNERESRAGRRSPENR